MPDYDIEIEYCYDIVLIDVGENRAKVIGLIRKLNHNNQSIKEIHSLIENLPCIVVECVVHRPEVQKVKLEFESIGATVELKEY